MTPRARLVAVARWVVPLALAAALVAAVPHLVGTTWRGVTADWAMVHLRLLPGVLALWIAGLWIQTAVQTAALPALTPPRALLLNAAGSAVANAAPLGGAAGIEVNRRMVGRWGISGSAYAVYVAVTNLVALTTKLTLPVLAVGVLVLTDRPAGPLAHLALAAGVAAVLLVAALASRQVAAAADALLALAARAGARLLRREPPATVGVVRRLRDESRATVAAGWGRMSLATVGYYGSQGLLMWCCLLSVGAHPGAPAVLAALAAERAASLVLITPAGTGIAEVAAAGVLVGLGVAPAAAAAGLLLHRLVVVGLEVPLGALLGGLWWHRTRTAGSLVR